MPITLILLLLYGIAAAGALIGIRKNLSSLKAASLILFLVGITITAAIALNNM